MGWGVVPLHDVTAGTCSCGASDAEHDRRQGGKHPRLERWQQRPIRDVATADAYWAAHPGANVGIATGQASGFWALDVDPDNGGDVRLQELIAQHGELPRTRTHVTGSGGIHMLWMPPVDFRPTNSRGRLPAGLDVRGDGGQIVVAPSVSGKGAYGVLDDAPIVSAPAWLEDLIRPAQYDRSAPAGVPPSPAGAPDRAGAYALTALAGLCDEMAHAVQGTRNETAFRVACRVRELANAGWLAEDRALQAYLDACERSSLASPGAPFDIREALDVWGKATRRVAGLAAELPPDLLHGEVLPAPTGSAAVFADPFVDAGAPPPPAAEVTPAVTHSDPVSAMLAEMLTLGELAARPKPRALIAGLLDLDTAAWMIGKSGSFKSFVALDMAAHVASGRRWQGRHVTQGPVLYVCAEGDQGMTLRAEAWIRTHGHVTDLNILPRPVQVAGVGASGEWPILIEVSRRLAPSLIVIDTQARCSLGLEENSATDMSVYVSAVDALRRATGACVLTVHHIGRNGNDARGSSVIDGAQDTELRVERVSHPGGARSCRVHQDKQKDSDDSDVVELGLTVVEMGHDAMTGRALTSLVITGDGFAAPVLSAEEQREAETLDATGQLATVLRTTFATGNGGTKAEIKAAFMDTRGSTSKATWYRAWNEAMDRKIMGRVRGTACWRYVPPEGREEMVEPTDSGSKHHTAFYAP